MNTAQMFSAVAHSDDCIGGVGYCRPRDSALEAAGGRLIDSSNWGNSSESFSPTETWEFQDGSQLRVAYSYAEAI